MDSLSFISTQANVDAAMSARIGELSGSSAVSVFTSMNAVEAVAGALKAHNPSAAWKIFCIGAATRRFAAENFGEDSIAGTAGSAGALADVILSNPVVRAVVFFCGDQRRNELPERLRQAGVRVEEIVVYRTMQTPHKVGPIYDAVIFFSPSAVHSFFSDNILPDQTLLFAIGDTTARAIRQYTGNKTIVSASPDKEALVLQVIDYFSTNNIHH